MEKYKLSEEQVRFLQEIGCSKLQDFFFSKPQPVDTVIEYHRNHKLTGYENPEESSYYSLLCGVNLYDVGVIAREEKTSLQNAYNTLPMCIIEVRDDRTRFARTNQIKENQSDLDFVQYRIIRKDGEVRWLNEYGHYMKYDEQNSFYYVFISDITDKFGRKGKQR